MPARFRRCWLLHQVSLVLPAIEYPQNDNAVVLDSEGDCDATLKANDTQARTNILAQMTPLGSKVKSQDVGFQALDIGEGYRGTRSDGDPIVKAEKIGPRVFRKFNGAAFHESSVAAA
jgi:hypothetical protein